VLLRAIPHPRRADGAVVALRDVSERAALRDEVEAGRRMTAVSRLAGAVAHEINNPLTVLQLRSDLLLEELSLPAGLRDQVAVLRDSAARIAQTLRMLQRMGRPVGSLEWIAVADLVEHAVAATRGWAGAGRVVVEPLPAVGVNGDPDALGLALELLVTLACDPGGGRIRVAAERGTARIEIATEHARWNAGPILDPTTTPSPPDRLPGLGLSVAATIAREHGGDLAATVAPPRGGALSLRLPLSAPRQGRRRRRRARVLVVDDDPLVAQLAHDWARRSGNDVEVAHHPASARRRLEAEPFDAVLADARCADPVDAWLTEHRPDGPPVARIGAEGLRKPFTRSELAELLLSLLAR
jgi:hypothetical protein